MLFVKSPALPGFLFCRGRALQMVAAKILGPPVVLLALHEKTGLGFLRQRLAN
jgi:hypothetical protein